VVSVLDSGAEGPGFKSQPRRCRVTVLGKLLSSSETGSSPFKGCEGNYRPGDDGPVYHARSVHLRRAKSITRFDDRYAKAKFSKSSNWENRSEIAIPTSNLVYLIRMKIGAT